MNNYPAGAEHDSNAPWNATDDGHIEAFESKARGLLANELPDLLYEVIKEVTSDDHYQDVIYDNIMTELKKVWER